MTSAIVTGGAGFIGSHLTDMLLSAGHSVTVIDNLASGKLRNLEPALSDGRLKFVQADIRDQLQIEDHFDGVDWVFHLAGLADIVPSINNPQEYFSTNVTGTLNVLQASRDAGTVKRFIYAASSSSYGMAEIFPTPESAPIAPQYPYALTKYMGEELVLHWSKVFALPSISLRLFNVFGPRSRTSGAYGAVFGVFLAQKLAGRPFTVVGDGSQTRDFTFVTDVARAFILAAQSEVSGTAMNVGSGGCYSVNRLVELLGGEVERIPKRPGEPGCTFADTSRIRALLDWTPRVSFEDGVKLMLDNIDLWKDAPLWDKASIGDATRDWFKYLRD